MSTSRQKCITLPLAIYLFRQPTEPTMYKYNTYEQMDKWKCGGPGEDSKTSSFQVPFLTHRITFLHTLIHMTTKWIIYIFQKPCLIRCTWTLFSYQKCLKGILVSDQQFYFFYGVLPDQFYLPSSLNHWALTPCYHVTCSSRACSLKHTISTTLYLKHSFYYLIFHIFMCSYLSF